MAIECKETGVYLKNGEILPAGTAGLPAPDEAREGTIAYQILRAHDKSADPTSPMWASSKPPAPAA